MNDNKGILFEKREHVGIITLNRPQRMNALNIACIKELCSTLDTIEKDSEIKAVIITGGQDNFFCTGVDIKDDISIEDELLPYLRNALAAIENSKKPFIAAISGLAVGGGLELTLVCDLRIVADNAEMGLPEIILGAFPGAGGIDRLPRLIGMTKAKEMILLGNRIKADEAYQFGLVNRVVPLASLMDECMEVARKLAEKSPLVMAIDKYAINKGMMMDLQSSLINSLQCFTVVSKSEDMEEGRRAFVEKRKPVWRGK